MRFLFLALALVACSPATDTGDENSEEDAFDPNADPDVNSYIPPNYRAQDPSRIIYLGDSITRGDGASPRSERYTALLEENVDSAWPDYSSVDATSLFPSIAEVIDVSKGGATSRSLLKSQLPSLSDELGDTVSGPSIVVMTIGGNDMQAAIPAVLFGGDAAADAPIAALISNLNEIVDYFEPPCQFMR